MSVRGISNNFVQSCTLQYGFTGTCTFSMMQTDECESGHQLVFPVTHGETWEVVEHYGNEILVDSRVNNNNEVNHCFNDGHYELHIHGENGGSVNVSNFEDGTVFLTCVVEDGSCYKKCDFTIGSSEVNPIDCDENHEFLVSIQVHDQEGCGKWHNEISWNMLIEGDDGAYLPFISGFAPYERTLCMEKDSTYWIELVDSWVQISHFYSLSLSLSLP